ncbi:TPA: hypothetical protein HA235_01910 [Candidatus Woesearchaeota archaeon]|nr:hypothetical protein [Candidatus Woesearchaeota archaeon]HIH31440.1 hypothetical protein [Candidatus Woesearchaeota archaeon]HIH54775.1 hypothetical protein [Candidatus Woesearchaeota archaeon]HIJ01276.1 hypothetical protein [Candidatus Woesearchaeota archaeon]HIJ13681.1 hypothetical protein [Candidatus Woesearchaeota archaeon]
MQDKTTVYMFAIVALVLLVAIVAFITTAPSNESTTANVVYAPEKPVTVNTFGKLFITAFLLGIAAYMYFSNE